MTAGRVIASNGYVLVRVGRSHHLADVRGYAYEHRLAAEVKLGRRLRPREIVHHVDGDKQNNAPENLEVHPNGASHRAEHRRTGCPLRRPGQQNPLRRCACGCGAEFLTFDRAGRPRRFVSGHNRPPAPAKDAVAALLRGGPMHRSEISRATGKPARVVATTLSRLRADGKAVPLGGGRWAPTG